MDLSKYLPTAEMQEEFEKFKALSEKERVEFQRKREQRIDNMTEEERNVYLQDASAGLDAVLKQADDFISRADEAILRDKLGELPEAISFSYIAKKYFGKSRNWLYQRINGYNVNGKPAKFTKEEYDVFIQALNDISQMINKTSLSLS